MNIFSLRKYLRLNRCGNSFKKGTYSLRMLCSGDSQHKSRRIELGLATSNEEEAIIRAALIIRAIYGMGGVFSKRIKVNDLNIAEYMEEFAEKDFTPRKKRNKIQEMPLFEFLPPHRGQDKQIEV